jgi:multimeric flavodoxin WrbA
MKILVIMGSPRKKDGYKILLDMEGKLKAEIEADFEYIYLAKENIDDCKGCDQCFKKGEQYCPNKDAIEMIISKMENSDGIIFACPVYAHQITAPMKKFIDRLSYFFHRPRLFGKFGLILATTGSTGLKSVTGYLSLICTGWGIELIDKIGVISPEYFKEEANQKYKQAVNDKIKKAVGRIINYKVKTKSPNLFSLFMFLAMREKVKRFQCDLDYWEKRGWFLSNYYYQIKMGLFKYLLYLIMKNFLMPIVIK